mgnify:CR=1 FL=1|tara:strand:- start:5262 stop:5825 length:564 start_codon:yes stop_codon:yes gene_type:complete
MKTKNIERYLNSFGKYIVKQSKANLTRGQSPYGTKNATKALYNSLSFKVEEDDNGFSLKLFMLDYGKFIDKGVSGKTKIREYTTYDGRKVASPYQYTNRMPPPSALDKWIVRRGLAPRKKSGQFTGRKIDKVGFAKSIQFLVARKIFFQGIKSSSFFQRPIGLGLQRFGKDILKAIKQDIIDTVNNN